MLATIVETDHCCSRVRHVFVVANSTRASALGLSAPLAANMRLGSSGRFFCPPRVAAIAMLTALLSFSAIFDEASKRASPEAPHCLSIFYPGFSVDAAAASMQPSLYFHALLDTVVGICEAVAREELLHASLKVILEVKRRANGFSKAH